MAPAFNDRLVAAPMRASRRRRWACGRYAPGPGRSDRGRGSLPFGVRLWPDEADRGLPCVQHDQEVGVVVLAALPSFRLDAEGGVAIAWGGSGAGGLHPAMIRTHSPALAWSVISGKWRRNSTMPDSS